VFGGAKLPPGDIDSGISSRFRLRARRNPRARPQSTITDRCRLAAIAVGNAYRTCQIRIDEREVGSDDATRMVAQLYPGAIVHYLKGMGNEGPWEGVGRTDCDI